MRILSYNICNGSTDFTALAQLIQEIDADVVCLQETNDRDTNGNFELFKEKTGYSHSAYAGGSKKEESNTYSVATYSKFPLLDIYSFDKYMKNASLNTTVQSSFGPIAICNTHLSPINEEDRLREIYLIRRYQKRYEYSLIIGDLNTLSPIDPYDPGLAPSFNDVQKAKFCNDAGEMLFDTYDYLIKNEQIDVAHHYLKHDTQTVPTRINIDPSHSSELRLDYAFSSLPLQEHLASYDVIINDTTHTLSDHYPLIMSIEKKT